MKIITVISYRLFDTKLPESSRKVKSSITAEVASPVDTAPVAARTEVAVVAVWAGNRAARPPGKSLAPAVAVDTLVHKIDMVAGVVADNMGSLPAAGKVDTVLDTVVVAVDFSSSKQRRIVLRQLHRP